MKTLFVVLSLSVIACGAPAPTCDASSCSGCCDATGQCRTGTELSACGSAGVECSFCATGFSCEQQACRMPTGFAGGSSGGGAAGGSASAGGSAAGGSAGGGG
ncbi:MAG: hypothetical protein IAE78_05750, partial [Myxococcus sp.]|nr:hypothetical protein [Myxococcus sp.]